MYARQRKDYKMEKVEFIKQVKAISLQKLGRASDSVITNSALSEIIGALVDTNTKGFENVLNYYKNIKPAKSIEALCEHIRTNAQQGTRSDRTELDESLIDLLG